MRKRDFFKCAEFMLEVSLTEFLFEEEEQKNSSSFFQKSIDNSAQKVYNNNCKKEIS